MKYDVKSVKAYLDAVPADRKPALQEMIRMIKSEAPKTEETFTYSLPFYPLDGEPLFAIASQKHFLAFYNTDGEMIEKFLPRMGKVTHGKNCIRFRKWEDIDPEVLKEMIRESYKRREQKVSAKKGWTKN